MNMNDKKLLRIVLLNLRTAFDTVNHDILINRLQKCAGISGSVLNTSPNIICGVPQGSILETLLFSHCMLPLGNITRKIKLIFIDFNSV